MDFDGGVFDYWMVPGRVSQTEWREGYVNYERRPVPS